MRSEAEHTETEQKKEFGPPHTKGVQSGHSGFILIKNLKMTSNCLKVSLISYYNLLQYLYSYE